MDLRPAAAAAQVSAAVAVAALPCPGVPDLVEPAPGAVFASLPPSYAVSFCFAPCWPGLVAAAAAEAAAVPLELVAASPAALVASAVHCRAAACLLFPSAAWPECAMGGTAAATGGS